MPISAYRTSEKSLARLSAANPSDAEYGRELAKCNNNLGNALVHTEGVVAARGPLLKAVSHLRSLDEDQTTDKADAKRLLGFVLCNAAKVLQHIREDVDDAKAFQRQAIEIAEAITAEGPSNAENYRLLECVYGAYRRGLAKTKTGICSSRSKLRQHASWSSWNLVKRRVAMRSPRVSFPQNKRPRFRKLSTFSKS